MVDISLRVHNFQPRVHNFQPRVSGLPRNPTNQIRVFLARAELRARAAGGCLGVYKASRVAT